MVTEFEESTSKNSLDRLDDYFVVDTDVHEHIEPTDVLPYIDDRWKPRLRNILRSDEPLAQGVGAKSDLDISPDLEVDTMYGFGSSEIGASSPAELEAFMDRFNTDCVILHGNPIMLVDSIPDHKFAAAISEAYNDYLLDNWLGEHEGVKAAIRVVFDEPRHAAEEIRRLQAEEDFVSVHTSFAPESLLGDSKYEPIYEAAERAGLPIETHPLPIITRPYSSNPGNRALSNVEKIVTDNAGSIAHLPSLVFNGVTERFPTLDFVTLEAGTTWLPWLAGRMDRTYERRQHDFPELDRLPSQCLRDQFYFNTHPLEDVGNTYIEDFLRMFDEDMEAFMYASDFPHFDFDYPSAKALPRMDREAEAKVFGENAKHVYGF